MFHACEYLTTRTVESKQPTGTILNEGDCVENTVNFKKLIKCEIVQNSPISSVDKYYGKDNDKRIVTAIQSENANSEYNFAKIKQDDKNERNSETVNEVDNDLDKNNHLKSKESAVIKGNFLSHLTNGRNNIFNNMKKFIVKRSAANASTDLNRNLNGLSALQSTTNGSLDKNTNVQENTDVVDYW